jgi:hypothetical protein
MFKLDLVIVKFGCTRSCTFGIWYLRYQTRTGHIITINCVQYVTVVPNGVFSNVCEDIFIVYAH